MAGFQPVYRGILPQQAIAVVLLDIVVGELRFAVDRVMVGKVGDNCPGERMFAGTFQAGCQLQYFIFCSACVPTVLVVKIFC